jgi:hypothetical protein
MIRTARQASDSMRAYFPGIVIEPCSCYHALEKFKRVSPDLTKGYLIRMRNLETMTLAACIGLVGVAIWEWHHGFPGLAVEGSSPLISPVNSAVGKKTTAIHGRVAKNPASQSVTSRTDERSGFITPDFNSGTTVVPPPPGVPDSEKMEIGTTRSELKERYGTPALAVESVRNGSLVERYYYLKPDHVNLVVATLSDGKLVSAQTAQLWQPQKNNADQPFR